jgi:acyl carrier protein
MSADEATLAATRGIIEQVIGPARTPKDAGPDSRLGDGFWLDSVELLEVIVACEQAFGIEFDDDSELEWRRLETLGALADLIRAKRSARSSA